MSGARRARTSLPFSLFGDSFNLDDLNSGGSTDQPPPMLMEAVRAMGGSPESMGHPGNDRPGNDREPSSNQPLLIELQGGRYVRVGNTAIDGEALPLNLGSQALGSKSLAPAASSNGQSTRGQSTRAPLIVAETRVHDLPAAVLVFRDGRSEEVRDYTIADGMLYARGDFYTDGYWNKKIDLATLDLPQTLQANAARNVKFILPTSPNEVVTRP